MVVFLFCCVNGVCLCPVCILFQFLMPHFGWFEVHVCGGYKTSPHG